MEPNKIKVLVVEDSLTQAGVLKYILEINNYSVRHSPDGKKALELLDQYVPDIIISDIVMPGMDGYQFCSIIKADEQLKKIPVILLSALSVPRDIMKGLESGADSFLVKPYSEEMLIARIQYFVQNRDLRVNKPNDDALEILFANEKYSINSSSRQILDVLLSTYEITIHKNQELNESNKNLQIARDNLTLMNVNLEEKIRLRTLELEKSNENLLSEIEEHKATVETLLKSEEKWKKLVTNIPDYIGLYDHKGRYLYLNHFPEGFTMKEIEGKHVTDFQVGKSKIIYEKAFERAAETGETQYVQHQAFGDNFTTKEYESYIVPIFDDGKFMNMLTIARDITDRKKSENELNESNEIFSQFMEHSPIYIFFKDENIRTLKLSRNFEDMLGKPLEELIGKKMDELFASDLAKKMIADDLQILKNGQEVSIEEEMNGRQYITKKFPIQIEGKPSFLAGYTIDITESKRAEQVINENEKRLLELNATKDKFFSIIAHDLKNPFNAVIGFSDILIEQVLEKNFDGIEQYARIIQHSSQQAMDLLMNLMEWSRSQTGKMEYKPETVEMVALINDVTELLNDLARKKSITISKEIPQNISAFADKAMISTILRNLVSNAIKFTHPGGKIVLSAEQKPDEWVFSVSDNGVGIKKEAIEKLFRIDENNSTPGTQNEKGTGLGLILCKEFVEKHGGKIWAESEVGKGSKFCFTIQKSEVI